MSAALRAPGSATHRLRHRREDGHLMNVAETAVQLLAGQAGEQGQSAAVAASAAATPELKDGHVWVCWVRGGGG